MADFTHLDDKGHVRMADVTQKEHTDRTAIAQALVHMKPETFQHIQNNTIKKGNVLETARIAGIMAAKKTSEIIPMCHPLSITHAAIDFIPDASLNIITIQASVRTNGPTGVEMEALTAASTSALTIYDMCKSYDKEIQITDIFLLEKSGGKSGHYKKVNRDA
jgi:cyclic pyranopterin phosphate synthase